MYTHDMALEEQIGQILMVGFWGTTPSLEIIDLIQRYHVGNIILFSRNIRDARQVLELTQSLQMIAKEAGQRSEKRGSTMAMITCIRCGRTAEPLGSPPMGGRSASTSAPAWSTKRPGGRRPARRRRPSNRVTPNSSTS